MLLQPFRDFFLVNTIGMYSNADTNHGIQVMRDLFDRYKDNTWSATPVTANISQYSDNYWLYLIGCAMGTSAAINYSYLDLRLLEMTSFVD